VRDEGKIPLGADLSQIEGKVKRERDRRLVRNSFLFWSLRAGPVDE